MIDYQYQHAAHVMDWRMHEWMQLNPRRVPLVPTDEQIEYERNWVNFQSQLYYGWIKR